MNVFWQCGCADMCGLVLIHGVVCCCCCRCSAAFLKERLFDQSDAYRVHVCERSGLIAVANLKKQHYSSQIYGADSQVVQVRPGACGLTSDTKARSGQACAKLEADIHRQNVAQVEVGAQQAHELGSCTSMLTDPETCI